MTQSLPSVILPPGWAATTLAVISIICDDLRQPVNVAERAKRTGPYPYYGATGQVGWIDGYLMDGENLLLGEDGAPFLDPAKPKAYKVVGKAWVNNHAHILRPIDSLTDIRFLLHSLNAVDYRPHVNGTTRLKLTQAAMRQIPISLPPLPEQHRIVAEIERQFSLLDAGVANLKRVQANLKRYRAAVLQAACTGQLVPTEAELAQAEGRAYEPAAVLLTRILAERRARWEAEQWAKKNGQPKASGPDLFSGNEVVNGLEHLTLNQGVSASPGTSALSLEWGGQGQSAALPLAFNESASGLDTPGAAVGSAVEQLFRKQQVPGSPTSPVPPELGAREPLLKGYKEPAAPDTSGLPELPEGWVWASPEQLASPDAHSLVIGPFGSDLKVSDYRENGVPLVFVRDIRSSVFGGSNTRYVTSEKAERLKAHKVMPGDVLITKMGDPPGDACLYPVNSPPAIATADCIKWALSPTLPDARFFVNAVNSHLVKDKILEITKGVAQLKVSLGRFRQIAIPLPPSDEQSRIVAEVERRLSVVDNLEQVVKANLKRAERLRQAILKEAFAGRLVPQDPADEPASVLLERIKAERETQAKTRERRTMKSQVLKQKVLDLAD